MKKRIDGALPPGNRAGRPTPEAFAALPDLKRAAQKEALKEWNGDPARPHWDLEGRLARRIYPTELEHEDLHYLSPDGRSQLTAVTGGPRRKRKAERAAIALLRDLAAWCRSADGIAEKCSGDDGMIGPAMDLVRALVGRDPFAELRPTAAPLEPGSVLREQIQKWDGVIPFRVDAIRGDLALDAAAELGRHGRVATARDLALASLLCGLFPAAISNGLGRTPASVDDVIRAETKAMERARKHRTKS